MHKKKKRQYYIIGIIGALILIFIGSSLGGGNNNNNVAQASGKLEIPETNYDFGVIGLEDVSHEFLIKNTGEGTLSISRVATSCGCTSARLKKAGKTSVRFGMDHGNLPKPNMHLAPGEEAIVIVTYSPLAHGLDRAAGTFHRIVYIKTKNPKEEYELNISMKVDPNKKADQDTITNNDSKNK